MHYSRCSITVAERLSSLTDTKKVEQFQKMRCVRSTVLLWDTLRRRKNYPVSAIYGVYHK